MDLDARIALPGAVSAPGDARRFVARTLTPLLGREDVETAMLVTSELVTNATVHAGTGCELVLRGGANSLTIRVADSAPTATISPRPFSAELSSGRGLRMLETLCRRWGIEPAEDGKTVWCELTVRG